MPYALSAIKSSKFTDDGYKKCDFGKTTHPAFIKDYLERHNIFFEAWNIK